MENDLKEGDLESYITRDVQYHMLIAESSKNRVLVKVLETIRDILRQFIKKFFLAMPSSVSDSMTYHKRVYEAIRDHDPGAARERMEEHIKSLIDRVNESFNG
jgi:GntR family transcriptional repressor for pyruvate dehydrogenase complex